MPFPNETTLSTIGISTHLNKTDIESLCFWAFFGREFKDFLSVEDHHMHRFKEFRELLIRVKVLVILDLYEHLLHGSIGIPIPEPP